MNKNREHKLFSKDFTLVVIGQIISLFGNAAIRFALPLYLLNLTGSSALYGTVTACAFIPAILLSPIGGLIADRANKRNIMVILDFITAFIILLLALFMGKGSTVLFVTAALMLLYGIAGAYQPSVQASIPSLTAPEHFMAANSIINTVSSLASLLGPVLGGILYSLYGLMPVLWICTICFFLSAVMEIFIRIPFEKQSFRGSILQILKADFTESLRFICREKPIVGKSLIVICSINLFLSAMIVVAVPYLVTEVLAFEAEAANRLYGFAQGALAAGGLAGGVCAGVFAKKLSVKKTNGAGHMLIASALCVFPMSLSLFFTSSPFINYIIITLCCFMILLFSTVFTIQMMSFIQAETPQCLVGKVIAVVLAISMSAQPLGNALYGVLFEILPGMEYVVIFFAGLASLLAALMGRKLFQRLSSS